MSARQAAEIDALAQNLHRQWCNSSHHRTDRCKSDVAKGGLDWNKAKRLMPVVDQIVADALREAAADPGLRLSGHSGVSVTRLRERAAERVSPPGASS